ncbi:MAG: hypothetical protein BWY06_03442 [Candidatus Latescibacteria bacterium ADurb.Bin168]|nr:MAG: hypothetical protein BWY06_03442 [Candidatus Latescibacteria bacterium ADurb.Bin168]
MLSSPNWTIAERHMVRYHMSHLMWWALIAISAPVIALSLGAALVRIAVLEPRGAGFLIWGITAAIAVLSPVVAFVIERGRIRSAPADRPLRAVVMSYKHAKLWVIAVCGIGALSPVFALYVSGSFSPALGAVVLPLAFLVIHFPHVERFTAFVDSHFDTVESSQEPE